MPRLFTLSNNFENVKTVENRNLIVLLYELKTLVQRELFLSACHFKKHNHRKHHDVKRITFLLFKITHVYQQVISAFWFLFVSISSYSLQATYLVKILRYLLGAPKKVSFLSKNIYVGNVWLLHFYQGLCRSK